SGIYGLLANLKNVTTNGDFSVTFNLKSPQSTWPFILTTGAGTIVDHKVYPADKIVANTDVKNLVGTGPYVLSKFTPGQQAVFIRYLVLNVKRAPTNNPAVRKAIAYLFPRQVIASRVYHGNVQPLYSMVPAGLPGHSNSFGELYGMAPSTAKAAAVLKAAHVK